MLRTGPHPLSAASGRPLERSRRVTLRGEQTGELATDRKRAACRNVSAGSESAARQPAEAEPLHPVWRLLPEGRTGPLAAQMPMGLFRAERGLTAPGKLQDRAPKMELPATAALWASPTGHEQGPCVGREMLPATDGVLSGKKEMDSHEAPGGTVHEQAGRRTVLDLSCGSIAPAKARG